MGNAQTIPQQQHTSGVIKVAAQPKRRRWRRDCLRGKFSSCDDGSFPTPVPHFVEDKREIYLRRDKSRILRSLRRIKGIGRKRRKRLGTDSESLEEEIMSFYQPLEQDNLPSIQEAAWQTDYEEREQPRPSRGRSRNRALV